MDNNPIKHHGAGGFYQEFSHLKNNKKLTEGELDALMSADAANEKKHLTELSMHMANLVGDKMETPTFDSTFYFPDSMIGILDLEKIKSNYKFVDGMIQGFGNLINDLNIDKYEENQLLPDFYKLILEPFVMLKSGFLQITMAFSTVTPDMSYLALQKLNKELAVIYNKLIQIAKYLNDNEDKVQLAAIAALSDPAEARRTQDSYNMLRKGFYSDLNNLRKDNTQFGELLLTTFKSQLSLLIRKSLGHSPIPIHRSSSRERSHSFGSSPQFSTHTGKPDGKSSNKRPQSEYAKTKNEEESKESKKEEKDKPKHRSFTGFKFPWEERQQKSYSISNANSSNMIPTEKSLKDLIALNPGVNLIEAVFSLEKKASFAKVKAAVGNALTIYLENPIVLPLLTVINKLCESEETYRPYKENGINREAQNYSWRENFESAFDYLEAEKQCSKAKNPKADNFNLVAVLLNLDVKASYEDVKKAWRKVQLKWHSDKHKTLPTEANSVIISACLGEINNIVLKDAGVYKDYINYKETNNSFNLELLKKHPVGSMLLIKESKNLGNLNQNVNEVTEETQLYPH